MNRAISDIPSVIYVAGHGRSGSTILDALLGSSPDVVGLGELTHLPTAILEDQPCTCGDPLRRCARWRESVEFITGFGVERAQELTRRTEGARVFGRVHPDRMDSYRRFWSEVFALLRSVHHGATLIDSSKSMAYARGRFSALGSIPGLRLTHLHLVRDPRAVTWSAMRGPSAQFGVRRSAITSVSRSLLAWRVSNAQALRDGRESAGSRLLVRYEDLVADPLGTVNSIRDVAGLPILAELDSSVDRGHAVGGNRVRFSSGPLTMKADDEWRHRLGSAVSTSVLLASQPLAHRIGYR